MSISNNDRSKYENLLPQVVKTAKKAGAFIRQEFGNVTSGQVQVKSINSLVSYVDINAEKMTVEGLTQLLPEAGFITEEDTTAPSTKTLNWIIDPLDGTTNFLKGIPVFSVSIALVSDGVIHLGVVYDVMQDWCFSAARGCGSHLNGISIHVSKQQNISKSIIATGFPYKNPAHDSALYVMLRTMIERSSGMRRLGSAAIDLAYVACAKVEGYYETTLNSWDIAAGLLLIEEAGGVTTDFNGGRSMLESGEVVAANELLHKEMLTIIRETKS